MNRALSGLIAVMLSVFPAAIFGQSLPDWTGVWQVPGSVATGATIFDPATVNTAGVAGAPGVRELPPYNEEWEALYKQNIELVKQGRFPDPFTNCGMPAGYPRIMNLPDVYEFVVTPEQTWIISENGPNIVRLYTDGRQDTAQEDRCAALSGESVRCWGGCAMVVRTGGLHGSYDRA